ncbi:glycosyltransferase [Methylibium sp.]|uniref:glycosyltransferase n=1 Tax=Methylibium sp. TaxID=2067992 RepID=UPI003342E08C
MLKLGLLGHGFVRWTGGQDFLRLITASIAATGVPMELHALLPEPRRRFYEQGLTGTLWRSGRRWLGYEPPVARSAASEPMERVFHGHGVEVHVHRIEAGHSAIARASQRLGLHALLPADSALKPVVKAPWVGYIYDFQHRHLPQYFTSEESASRDRRFKTTLSRASSVIVNARDVASDIERYCPGHAAQVFALPFGAAPADHWFALDSKASQLKYGVTGAYFIISSQFWKHKDHLTAFRAFADVVKDYPELSLVCTGSTEDHRDPAYFPGLLQSLESLGITKRVLILGLIPKDDQIALLKDAVAVIQPTLFEGGPGGGAVYDAVALGVRSIISDIPVNLEIAEELVSFFPAGDCSSLAGRLRAALAAPHARSSTETLIENGQKRRRLCGSRILEAIEFARHQQRNGA